MAELGVWIAQMDECLAELRKLDRPHLKLERNMVGNLALVNEQEEQIGYIDVGAAHPGVVLLEDPDE